MNKQQNLYLHSPHIHQQILAYFFNSFVLQNISIVFNRIRYEFSNSWFTKTHSSYIFGMANKHIINLILAPILHFLDKRMYLEQHILSQFKKDECECVFKTNRQKNFLSMSEMYSFRSYFSRWPITWSA